MNSPLRYRIKLQASIDSDLLLHERAKHAAFCRSLRSASAPWTPLRDLPPLRDPGKDAETTLDTIPRKCFPPWIEEVMVDYYERTPAALALNRIDSAVIKLSVERIPNRVWVKSFLEILIAGFNADICTVANIAADMRHSDEMESGLGVIGKSEGVMRTLENRYAIDLIPEIFWISDGKCAEILGITTKSACQSLSRAGLNVSLYLNGLLVEGANSYLSDDDAYAVQARTTQVFKALFAH